MKKGFTLVELLVFTAIFTTLVIGFVAVLIKFLGVQTYQAGENDVASQGQFLVQQLQYYIQSARLVDMPVDTAETTLVLRESNASSSIDPMKIMLIGRTVYLTQGPTGVLQPLTSNKVSVSNLTFTRHYNLSSSSAAYGTDSVSYSFTMNYAPSSGLGTWITVPGNSTFGTSDFSVMKYAASCYQLSSGASTITSPNWNQAYDNSVLACTPANGNQITSLPNAPPIVRVSQTQAASYCASIGAHLITNNEWQTIAWNAENVASNWAGGVVGGTGAGTGAMFFGHNDASPWQVSAASSDDAKGYFGTDGPVSGGGSGSGGVAAISQRRTLTLSNGNVIWDMAGNVWQWTNNTIAGTAEPHGTSANGIQPYEFTDITNWNSLTQSTLGPVSSTWNSNQGIGMIWSENTATDTTVYGYLRGGDIFSGSYGGVEGTIFQHTPNDTGTSTIYNNLGFRCAQSGATGSAGGGGNQAMAYSQSFQSSAAVSQPVPVIALVQQTATTTYGTVNPDTTFYASYATANNAGDLLVAVVSYTAASTSRLIMTDLSGETWTKIADSASSTGNNQFAIFYMPDAWGGLNTTRVYVASGSVTNPTIFLYEYRGASVSPLDKVSMQMQTGTMQFSSGPVYPTSTVELAFGVTAVSAVPASGIAAGQGYTMESSSSVSNVFIEDQNVYVTGPVSATWSSSQAADSFSAVVTFTVLPSYWITVPGNALFGTSDFLVMKYAASCSDGGGHSVNTPVTTNNTYNNSTSTGLPCTPANGRQIASLPDGIPIANITQQQAIAACSSIGAHLLTNAEWQTIAWNAEGVGSNWTGGTPGSGNMFVGNWSASAPGALPASSSDLYGISQGRVVTLSNGANIWDMNGNVWQWVGDTIMGSHEPHGVTTTFYWYQFTDPTLVYNVMSQATVGPASTSWNWAQNIGDYQGENSSTDNTIYAFRRGGMALVGNGCNAGYCGINSLLLNALPTGLGTYMGFRCAAGDTGAGGTPTNW